MHGLLHRPGEDAARPKVVPPLGRHEVELDPPPGDARHEIPERCQRCLRDDFRHRPWRPGGALRQGLRIQNDVFSIFFVFREEKQSPETKR